MPIRLSDPYSDLSDPMQLRRYLDELVRDITSYTSEVENSAFTPTVYSVAVDTDASGNFSSYFVDASAGARTISLPSPVAYESVIYVIKKTDSSGNAVIVNAGTFLIDGVATKSLATQHYSIMVQSDGSNWQIIGKVV